MNYQNPDGSWTAIGVMSQCERKGNPVAQTRIKYYLDWIQSMKQNDSATCIAPTYITPSPEVKFILVLSISNAMLCLYIFIYNWCIPMGIEDHCLRIGEWTTINQFPKRIPLAGVSSSEPSRWILSLCWHSHRLAMGPYSSSLFR